MEYRSVGNRIAVILDSLKLKISDQEIIAILTQKGFKVIEVELITLARQCIGVSQYRRGAKLSEAPAVVDCSGFNKWVHGRLGIWIPRRSIQQRELGEVIQLHDINEGDVAFASGAIDYFDDEPGDGVGHVGIATGGGTIIHAANKEVGVVESTIDNFFGEKGFRGLRRYIPRGIKVLTLEIPPGIDVETSDDLRWIVLRSLH